MIAGESVRSPLFATFVHQRGLDVHSAIQRISCSKKGLT
ncbi:hypothetical protein ACVWWQ_003088 [Rhodanobacter sp. TND4EL1]